MSKSPEEREEWIENVRVERLSDLPAPDWMDEIETDEEELVRSGRTLGAVYRDLGFSLFAAILALVPSLILIDTLFYLSPQIYGLYIDVLAAMFFLTPGLNSPEDIAVVVSSNKRAIRIKEAEEMVAHNVGFITLLTGFGIQGAAIQSQRTELVGENILSSLPGYFVYILLPLAGVLAFLVLGKVRNQFRKERAEGYPVLMGDTT